MRCVVRLFALFHLHPKERLQIIDLVDVDACTHRILELPFLSLVEFDFGHLSPKELRVEIGLGCRVRLSCHLLCSSGRRGAGCSPRLLFLVTKVGCSLALSYAFVQLFDLLVVLSSRLLS